MRETKTTRITLKEPSTTIKKVEEDQEIVKGNQENIEDNQDVVVEDEQEIVRDDQEIIKDNPDFRTAKSRREVVQTCPKPKPKSVYKMKDLPLRYRGIHTLYLKIKK